VFVELMPLLAGLTVLITVAKVDNKTLRVNVIPHGKADENPALTTPLTYTGPPEELDAELGKHLAGYVQTHRQSSDPTFSYLGTLPDFELVFRPSFFIRLQQYNKGEFASTSEVER
jgi:PRTRC genetic system protein E